MKTTVDLPDELLREVQQVARAEGTTMRSLLEEGLRAVLARHLAAEAEVNRATEQLAAQRTTLLVAHRLTTASGADRIVVMSGGRVAEVGTHAELLDRAGVYAGLWAAFAGTAELMA